MKLGVVSGLGPFIYQKDPKYRKGTEIPERPWNVSIHDKEVCAGDGRHLILIFKHLKAITGKI